MTYRERDGVDLLGSHMLTLMMCMFQGPQEQERQKKEESLAKLQAMPEWKRNLVTKKGKD